MASPLRQTYLACHWHHEKFCKYTRQTGVSLEPSLDLTLSKSKIDIAHAYSYARLSVLQKNVSQLHVSRKIVLQLL
jgi:hypothetical protein